MGTLSSKQTDPVLCHLLSQNKTEDCLEVIATGVGYNVCDSRGRSPLRLALELGDVEVFTALIAIGAECRPSLPKATTFLHFAVSHGHYALSKLILRDHVSFPKVKNARDSSGHTALHISVINKDPDLLALLLKYNCDPTLKDKTGLTARDLAIHSNSPFAREMVDQLSAEDVMEKVILTTKSKTSQSSPSNQELLSSQKRLFSSPKDRSTKASLSTIGSKSTQRSLYSLDEFMEDQLETAASCLEDEIRDCGVLLIKSSELTFGEKINRGSSCEVFKAYWRGAPVAVKKFKDEYRENPKDHLKFLKEIHALARIQHPNLLFLLGICTDQPNLCLVTEFVPNMNLFHALHSKRHIENKLNRLGLRERFRIAGQVCKGLGYLHACDPPIIHRDLKPENCLLDHSLNVKIADFGLARPLTSFKCEEEMTTTCIGTTRFMAPELFEREKVANIGVEIDIWALGCLLIEVFSDRRPWDYISSSNVTCLYYEVRLTQIFKKKPVPIPETIPEEVRDIIERCCDYNPKSRPTAKEVEELLQAAYRLYS